MDWKSAILKVLEGSSEPMHYVDIADEVAKRGYRGSDELGATPSNSVNSVIRTSIREDVTSPFTYVAPGYYFLKNPQLTVALPAPPSPDSLISENSGIINSLGMFWSRSKVIWKSEPRLLGKQQLGSSPVDFSKQIGIYFLHDAQGVVYVGRAIEQSIGRRLFQHTVDRLNGRWDRFSWFGLYPIDLNSGEIKTNTNLSGVSVDVVISTLEAVLIEGLEPRQNRKRGDDFQAVEFLQVEDLNIEISRNKALLQRMISELNVNE